MAPFALERWEEIAAECLALPRDIAPFDRSIGQADAANKLRDYGPAWVPSWGPARDGWLTYPLIYDKKPVFPGNCPNTMALLADLDITVAGFSWLKPRTNIPIHSHPENVTRTYHLGLQVPPFCSLITRDGIRHHKNGHCVAFDGTDHHAAWNASDQDRYILYIEGNLCLDGE